MKIVLFLRLYMQKFTELLNAIGNCLCGAAKLFGEYNTYREASVNRKNLLPEKADSGSKKKKD